MVMCNIGQYRILAIKQKSNKKQTKKQIRSIFCEAHKIKIYIQNRHTNLTHELFNLNVGKLM